MSLIGVPNSRKCGLHFATLSSDALSHTALFRQRMLLRPDPLHAFVRGLVRLLDILV
jgi:hypothetical protein